jgi:outer membrane lipoprotein-sorting protein
LKGDRPAAKAAAVALALCCAGCPRPPPPSQFPSASDALARMKQTYACANGVQGEGKIDQVSSEGRVRGEILLFAVNPARVRIDVISPFGAMLYTLTSNGERFQMLDVKQKHFQHGPASACNLARLTQVPMPGHVLVSLMRGEAPLLEHQAKQARLRWDDGHYLVEIEGAHQASQTVHLEVVEQDFLKPWSEQRLRVTHMRTAQQGRVLYRADLSDHELTHTAPPREDPDGLDPPIPPSGGACDVEVPRTIRMVVPHSGRDVEFRYNKVAFNPPIPAGAFSQPIPGGVRKQFVTCQD